MKANIILAVIVFLLALVPGNAQTKKEPRNIQCKVFEITKQEANQVECKALSMQGDTVFVRYGWQSFGGRNRAIKVGTWLSIRADWNDKQCEWILTKIKINH
jgi:hypothetical protein